MNSLAAGDVSGRGRPSHTGRAGDFGPQPKLTPHAVHRASDRHWSELRRRGGAAPDRCALCRRPDLVTSDTPGGTASQSRARGRCDRPSLLPGPPVPRPGLPCSTAPGTIDASITDLGPTPGARRQRRLSHWAATRLSTVRSEVRLPRERGPEKSVSSCHTSPRDRGMLLAISLTAQNGK